MRAVAELLGATHPETVRTRVWQAEIDVGAFRGVTSAESAEPKRLWRENAELERANAILKSASARSSVPFGQLGGHGVGDLRDRFP